MQPELLQRMPAALLSLSVALVPFLVLEQGLSPLLSVRGLVESFNLAQVAGRTTLLAGTVLVAAAGAGPSAFLAAQVAGQSVSGLLCAAALLRHDGFRWPAARSVGRVLGVSLQLHPAALGSFFIVWLNAILVSRQAGFAAAGQYQAAWSGIQLLLTLPQGAMLVLFSHIGTRGVDGAWRADRLKVAAGVVGMSALAAAASPAVPWAVQMVFGASYGPAVAIVRTLLWTVPGATLSLLMTPQWIGRGLFAATSCLTLGVGLVGGAASLWLIPQRGAQGAALSSVGAFAAVLLIQSAFALWLNRRVRRQPAATTA